VGTHGLSRAPGRAHALLAKVVRDASGLLRDPAYAPEYPAPAEPEPMAAGRTHHGVSISDLIGAGLLEAGDILINAGDGGGASARILPDGQIEYDGDVYEKVPAAASQAKGGSAVNGWEYWHADAPEGLRPLAALREQHIARTDEPEIPHSSRPLLAFRDAVHPLDGDDVIIDHVHDPVPADAQPVISAPVEGFPRTRVTGQGGDGRADGPHAVLVAQVTAR
jgi:Restriction Enzyme Adenine Methylase Associated